MRFIFTLLLFFQGWLCAVQTDFDVTIVGTSPVSMLEAIYHIAKNERVLVLEADARCGGAWKSIDICGVSNADLGCHVIGSDTKMKEFFEKYFGCRFICLDHPYEEADDSHQRCSTGFYFSGGCYELISCLEAFIRSHANAFLLKKRLESIFIDSDQRCITLRLEDAHYTTGKLILTSAIFFRVDNASFSNVNLSTHAYPHLYMLVEDPTPVRFTYVNNIPGASRAMNLTPFLQMAQSNLQLIAVQTHTANEIGKAQEYLDAFKAKNLLTANARIIAVDTYTYNQGHMNMSSVQRLGGPMIELLDSSSFAGMGKYLDKWRGALVPIQ